MDPAEAELISKCRTGDASAWDQVFDLHYAPTTRFVWQLNAALTPEDVEEICQETFLTVIRSLDSFHGQSKLQTWIFRIAANKTYDLRERSSAQKRGGGKAPLSLQAEDPETGLALDPPSPAPKPDEAYERREVCEWVTLGMAQLGRPCQEILELRYFGDLSYDEIANSLDLNPKTVSSRLSKCLDKLEEVLKPMIPEGKKLTDSV